MSEKSSSYLSLEKALFNCGKSISSIETLSKDARSIGLIDDRMYQILQYSLPFEHFSRRKTKKIASMLDETPNNTIEIRYRAYRIIESYLLQPGADNLYDVEINLVPWPQGSLTRKTITNLSLFFGKKPTVEQVLAYFQDVSDSDGYLDIYGFGNASLEITKKTFERLGIELPAVKLRG